MNAHIRSVSSETVAEDANIHDAYENAEGHDEAPIGLPEEGGSNRNDGLGEAPPLIAEREDRAVGADDATAETKKGVAKLFALAWRRQAKAPAPVAGEGNEGEPKEGAPDSAAEARKRDGEPGNPASVGDNHPVGDDSQGRDSAAVAAKAKRPILKRKGALAPALAAGVAIPAIVVLNWPHSAAQPVEPGMQADGQTKVMAPSAALATAPPREALNVSLERPLVNETRRDELNEMLSFRGGDKAADGSTPKADAPTAVPAAQPPVVAEARETAQPAPAHPASERNAVPPSAPEATPPAPIDPAKSADAAQTLASHLVTAPSLGPTSGAVARDPAPLTAALPPEPGLGGAAKIEARLADLETAVKDRSNEARARLDAEKAETHTLEKIAELGALVTRLTGQVKDLQDKVQTLSTGADEKFADLTRRVALGEANRAVASAENAGSGGLAGPAREKGSADGSEAQERTRMKVAAADVKRNYRIQAASPGLAMLTAVDGSPDDRPVEVAIGTELPGYGKVLSIEQHGQAWVVKADRGSIE
ncbi:MAG: hypothetical protein WB715_00510 [Roseiarcus sp.]|uniref:hypothetical protein n=1 Tax=Roseiarcus sp. TaxID=1969460 RepID=UPI003C3C8773